MRNARYAAQQRAFAATLPPLCCPQRRKVTFLVRWRRLLSCSQEDVPCTNESWVGSAPSSFGLFTLLHWFGAEVRRSGAPGPLIARMDFLERENNCGGSQAAYPLARLRCLILPVRLAPPASRRLSFLRRPRGSQVLALISFEWMTSGSKSSGR